MDLATLMQMMQGAGGGAPAPGGQMGAMPQQAQPGFGLGQQLVQGGPQPGQDPMMAGAPMQAPQQGGLAGMMGAAGQAMQDPEKMQKMLMMMQMMQGQQGQQQGTAPMGMGGMMMQGRGAQQNNTQASRGYLASGGGLAKAQY